MAVITGSNLVLELSAHKQRWQHGACASRTTSIKTLSNSLLKVL